MIERAGGCGNTSFSLGMVGSVEDRRTTLVSLGGKQMEKGMDAENWEKQVSSQRSKSSPYTSWVSQGQSNKMPLFSTSEGIGGEWSKESVV